MARLSMNEVTTYRWTFDEDVERYAAAGFSAMGLWRQKLSDFGEERAIELLKDTGLRVSNVSWAGGFTGSDGRSFQESVDDAIDAVRLTGVLGCRCLVVYTGARGGHTHNHARRLITEAIRKLIPHAEEHGVKLALKPVHTSCSQEWTFLTSLPEALALVQSFESDRLGLALDTYHLGHDEAIFDHIAAAASYLEIVHLADALEPPEREPNRLCLGDGALPLPRLMQTLLAHDYQGDFDVEIIGEDVSELSYDLILNRTQERFEQLLAKC